MTIGYARMTIGYARMTIGYARMTIGYTWMTIGYAWMTIGYTRKVLVKNSLMELLALGLARRSVNLNDKLMLGQEVYLHYATDSEVGIGDIAQRILQLAGKVNEL